jgi:hypothetical protein
MTVLFKGAPCSQMGSYYPTFQKSLLPPKLSVNFRPIFMLSHSRCRSISLSNRHSPDLGLKSTLVQQNTGNFA